MKTEIANVWFVPKEVFDSNFWYLCFQKYTQRNLMNYSRISVAENHSSNIFFLSHIFLSWIFHLHFIQVSNLFTFYWYTYTLCQIPAGFYIDSHTTLAALCVTSVAICVLLLITLSNSFYIIDYLELHHKIL